MSELRDAKRALGFGVTFLCYAAWLAWEAYDRSRRSREATRAKLAFDNAQDRRAELVRQEGIE